MLTLSTYYESYTAKYFAYIISFSSQIPLQEGHYYPQRQMRKLRFSAQDHVTTEWLCQNLSSSLSDLKAPT